MLQQWQGFARDVFAPWYTQSLLDHYPLHCPQHKVRAWRLVCRRFGFHEGLRRIVLIQNNPWQYLHTVSSTMVFPDVVFHFLSSELTRDCHVVVLNFNRFLGSSAKWFSHALTPTSNEWFSRKLLAKLEQLAQQFESAGHGWDPLQQKYVYVASVKQVRAIRGITWRERVEILFRMLQYRTLPPIKFNNE